MRLKFIVFGLRQEFVTVSLSFPPLYSGRRFARGRGDRGEFRRVSKLHPRLEGKQSFEQICFDSVPVFLGIQQLRARTNCIFGLL